MENLTDFWENNLKDTTDKSPLPACVAPSEEFDMLCTTVLIGLSIPMVQLLAVKFGLAARAWHTSVWASGRTYTPRAVAGTWLQPRPNLEDQLHQRHPSALCLIQVSAARL